MTDHRKALADFLRQSENVLIEYDMHALDAEIALMRASGELNGFTVSSLSRS